MRRTIRSFVVRRGRTTAAQRQALEQDSEHYGIADRGGHLDFDRLFARRAPRVLDIGSGMGDSTLQLARRHPENDYIAVEVHPPGIGALMRGAREAGLDNIRVLQGDVVDALRKLIPPSSVDEVYVFFPDPWPKKRHHKRRLVNPEFISLLLPVMKEHARLFLATDSESLAVHMRGVCDADAGLDNLAGPGNFSPRPEWRPPTKFEQRGRRQSSAIHDLAYALAATSCRPAPTLSDSVP